MQNMGSGSGGRCLHSLALALLLLWTVDGTNADRHAHSPHRDHGHPSHVEGRGVMLRAGPSLSGSRSAKSPPAAAPPAQPAEQPRVASSRRDQNKKRKQPMTPSSTPESVRRVEAAAAVGAAAGAAVGPAVGPAMGPLAGTWNPEVAPHIRPPLLHIFDDDILSRRRMLYPHQLPRGH